MVTPCNLLLGRLIVADISVILAEGNNGVINKKLFYILDSSVKHYILIESYHFFTFK